MKGLQLLYQSIKAIGERDTSEDDEYGQGPPAKLKEKALGDLSPQLWTMVANIWVESHTALLSLMSNLLQDPQNNVLIEQTHMTGLQCNISLKILQLLVTKFLDILFSYSEDMTTKFFSEVLNMLTHSVICCNALHTINIEGVPKKVMHSIILGILKLLNCTQANNTLLFVPFLEPFLQFYLKEFEAELAFGDDAVFQEKYYVQIITFLADILSTSEYNVSDVGTEIPVAKAIILKLFTKDTILGLTRQTIFKYLKLTPKMLELWQEDAEEFILEEMSDAYQDKLQPCAEYFFFWLLRVDPSVLPQIGKVITTWIVDSDKKGTQGDTNFLLNKESCYFAFSLCGNDFRTPNDIQFRTFFLEHVLKYFPGQHMIVKRRIAYAIHMWSRQIQEEKLVRQAFEILIACFGVEDLVCRLWAAMSFKTLLAEFNFKSPKLVRYLGPAMEGVLKLVEVMNGGPITVQVLEIISNVIVKMGEAIRPYMTRLLANMNTLWDLSQEKKLVLAGIIRILGDLVAALVGSAMELEQTLLPFLEMTLDRERNRYLEVLDEGLMLWWYMLQQSPFLSMNMEKRFVSLETLLIESNGDTEIFQSVINVMIAYVLTGKQAFFNSHLNQILELLRLCLSETHRNSTIVATTEFLKICVRTFAADGVIKLQQPLMSLFCLFLSPQCPSAKVMNKGDRSATCSIASLFFELFLGHERLFFHILGAVENNEGQISEGYTPGTNTFCCFLKNVLEKVEPKRYKVLDQERLALMGLSILIDTNQKFLFPLLPGIIEKCFNLIKNIEWRQGKRTHRYRSKNTLILGSPGFRALDNLHSYHISALTDATKFLASKLQSGFQVNGQVWLDELQQVLRPETFGYISNVISSIEQQSSNQRRVNPNNSQGS
eukprot:TRINITY_DN5960_c0_g1_i9.p1 TRINITY_DN5960_c0_g1~~TRINITY_DN5960_c0_g1_i9.p1  ORF type:complete len:885 (+),score=192.22 TRINITY_DN5960_c0_g1_i9:561-3215(+)